MVESTPAILQYCAEQGIVFEAYEAMRACPFSNPQVQSIAAGHGVGVSQVCLRWVLQRGAMMAVGVGSDAGQALRQGVYFIRIITNKTY